MPIAAKICGISTPETIDAAVQHGASHIGLNFFAASPRFVAFGQATSLAMRVPDHIGRVGVFVDPDDTLVDAAITAGRLSALQLHKIAPARAAALASRTGLPIWVAIAVRTRVDLDAARDFVTAAHMILFDAKTPEDAQLPGGMGVRFDWGLLDGFRHQLPWALSGGLDALNVGDAIRQTRTPMVDVSSGVETAPGIKDIDKIAAFLKAASHHERA